MLAAVLRYLHRGEMGTFGRACSLAGLPLGRDDRFGQADLLFAAQLAGLVEVTYSDGIRSWWAAFDGDVSFLSHAPKTVPTTREWFRQSGASARPLITDQEGRALLLGADQGEDAIPDQACDFRVGFMSRIPSLRSVERQMVREESHWAESADARTEVFSHERAQWLTPDADHHVSHALVRTRTTFTGWAYHVVAQHAGIGFAIADPDWAFPIALNILGWDATSFVRFDAGRLSVRRAFRLPALLLRYLFANATFVTIGPTVVFDGMHEAAAAPLLEYLSLVRG
jgi:hypothetical protein